MIQQKLPSQVMVMMILRRLMTKTATRRMTLMERGGSSAAMSLAILMSLRILTKVTVDMMDMTRTRVAPLPMTLLNPLSQVNVIMLLMQLLRVVRSQRLKRK